MAAKKKKTPVAKKKVARKAPARKKKVTVVRKVVKPAPPAPPPAATSAELQTLAEELKAQVGGLAAKIERLDARVDGLSTQPRPETQPAPGEKFSRDSLAPLSEPMAAFVQAYRESQENRGRHEAMTIWAWWVVVILFLMVGTIALVGGKLSADAIAMVFGAVTVVAVGQVIRQFAKQRDD
jgi:hypothetical protein